MKFLLLQGDPLLSQSDYIALRIQHGRCVPISNRNFPIIYLGAEDTFVDDGSKNPLNVSSDQRKILQNIYETFQDDDDDYEPSDTKKKSKKGKKRKAKGEEKSKGKKKKKRKKNDSEEEAEEQAAESDDHSGKRGRKKKERDREEKSSKSSRHHRKEEPEEPIADTPSVDEVCAQLDLTDVDIAFTESHYQSLETYKMFTQFVKPILQKENSKAPSSKLMMLIAAKWREFCEENPNSRDDPEEAEPEVEKSADEEEEEEEPELEYQPKPSRSRRAAEKLQEPEESDEDDSKKKKKSAARSAKRGRKQKVPTLKIKFGKKKDQSSDEEEKVNYTFTYFNCDIKYFLLFRRVMQQAKSATAMLSLKKCY